MVISRLESSTIFFIKIVLYTISLFRLVPPRIVDYRGVTLHFENVLLSRKNTSDPPTPIYTGTHSLFFFLSFLLLVNPFVGVYDPVT